MPMPLVATWSFQLRSKPHNDLHATCWSRPSTVFVIALQTLDLFAQLCKQRGYPHVRLDGSIGQNKRQKLVTAFNDAQASHTKVILDPRRAAVSPQQQQLRYMCVAVTQPHLDS